MNRDLTPIIQRSTTTILQVYILHISPAHRLHHSRHAFHILGRHEQMNVIGHQDIGVNSHTISLSGVPHAV